MALPLTTFVKGWAIKNGKSIIKMNLYLMVCINLPEKIKDRAYVMNLEEYVDVGTHWIALFCRRSEIVYFDSFGVKHVPE